MKRFCCLLLVFASINVQSKETPRFEFPSQFHGVWDHSHEQCGKQLSTARVTIDSTGIEYWESFGEINKIISQTKTSLHVILSLSGEEESWLVESEFRLEKENLVDVFIDKSSSFSRVKCK